MVGEYPPLVSGRLLPSAVGQSGAAPSQIHPPLVDLLQRQPEFSGNVLFDPAFYRMQAGRAGVFLLEHPLAHYARQDAQGVFDPHPLFCSAYYRKRYPDVVAVGVDPLVHFLERGQEEGRSPNSLFSDSYLRSANVAVPGALTRSLEHYLSAQALLDPHPLFEAQAYVATYPESACNGDAPLAHYARTWSAQGLRFPPWGTALHPCRRARGACVAADICWWRMS